MIKSHLTDGAMEREPDLLPARMLNEFVYCPRLFYLEHVDGLFCHNADTRQGVAEHRRVDRGPDGLPAGGGSGGGQAASRQAGGEAPSGDAEEPATIHARSVTLSSEKYGLIAKLDLVEAQGNRATPVDYKRGSPKKLEDGSLGAWEPEQVQLCAQALVLREHGYQCDEGILFFWTTRQRVTIPIDDELVEQTQQAIRGALRTAAARLLPPPLVDSPKCPRCSLVTICLPDETQRCYQQDRAEGDRGGVVQSLLFDLGPQWENWRRADHATAADSNDGSWTSETGRPIRRLIAPRDEKRPLYLNTQGFNVGKSGQVLKIKEKGKVVQEIRLNDINQVNLFGNVQVSTQAIQELLRAEIPLIYFSYGGWFHGMTQPVGLKNILWRREQFRMADQSRFCLELARHLVSGKIRNQRTLLMRNHIEPPGEIIGALKRLAGESERVETLPQLLGIEGLAARYYFEHFAGMIKVADDVAMATGDPAAEGGSSGSDGERDDGLISWRRFDFRRRNRRPPLDPVNALLSLGYSLLSKDLTIAAAATGLDPYLGFYHQPRYGRPALALDLMEPFRPLVVDSAVLSAINQRMVTPTDFIAAGRAVSLTTAGRKGFFRAYEQRMDQLVTHPLFGYRVSYRRLLEIQTRLLARVLMGELRRYPVFVTR